MQLKKLAPQLALACLAMTGAAAWAEEPASSLSYNIGVVSDYRYRGISQSGRDPALQGGIDYADKSGFYVGTWASTIKWIKDSSFPPVSAKGPVEVDIYGGYKGAINDQFSYDVGGLYYWYAGNSYKNITGANANTFEIYGAITYSVATLKYSHSLTNLFGTPDSHGSGYLDLTLNFDLGNGWSLAPHVGHQRIAHWYSYTDYSLTVSKDFGDSLVASLGVVGTDKKNFFLLPGTGTKDLGKPMLVAGLKKTF